MNKREFMLQLMPFCGFYDSIFESSDSDYYSIKETVDYYNDEVCNGKEIFNENDFDIDYKKRRNDIIEAYLPVWKRYAPDVVEDVDNPVLDFSKYYNFRTDELFAHVTLKENWIDIFKSFIQNHHDWLEDRIKKDWTSYDGFMSFMSNDITEWDKYLSDEMDERYIATLIFYMMIINNNNDIESLRESIYMETMDDICDSEYIIPVNEEIQNKLNQAFESAKN